MVRDVARRLRQEKEGFALRLGAFLASLEGNEAPTVQTLDRPLESGLDAVLKRLEGLEHDVRVIQDTELTDSRNVCDELDKALKRIAALESREQRVTIGDFQQIANTARKVEAIEERLWSAIDRINVLEGKPKPQPKPKPMAIAAKKPASVHRYARPAKEAPDGALTIGEGAGRRLTVQGEEEVRRRYAAGESKRAIAAALGVSHNTVRRVVDGAEAGTEGARPS